MQLQRHLFSLALAGALSLALSPRAWAQAGKDGALTVGTANVVLNRYSALTADAPAGATTLTVASTSGLSTGDLVLLIQMQGASVNPANTSSYGAITAYNNAGNYELAVVQGVISATSFALGNALSRSYTAAGKAQIVRIPRYTALTVNAGASITGAAWDGATGGVVALEATGTTTISGSIVATGLGFRGGAFANTTATNNGNYAGNGNTGGEKGESIAGYGTTYPTGSRGRGAVANGGGGGNSVNAGGGGGANAGTVANWTGKGNPNRNAAWSAAWNLEGAGFATAASSGGGRGGYGVSDVDLDALTVGPDQASWGEYSRPNTGGLGGRPLDYSTNRLYLGGGGGTGDGNTGVAGVGGRGGGLIYLIGSTFNGGGTVVADGTAGGISQANNPFADGAGGGGGGGTIILDVRTAIGPLRLQANGGAGGNTENTVTKAYGPGGGGGAGYVGFSSATFNGLSISQLGGANGVSTSPGLTEFPPNGATLGGSASFAFRTFGATPLPVTWKGFTATWDGSRTRLVWATASELSTQSFVTERSTDGRTFTAFGQPIAAAGSSFTERRYTAFDPAPPARQVYYRIRQVDTDGATSYTPVVVVQTQLMSTLGAYPNPVRRGQRLRTGLPTGATPLLLDLLGRSVPLVTGVAPDGTLDINTQSVAAGVYFLTLPGGVAQRLVVQE
ncbi:T9SS type A sorting domain-containing protein [Hymenobacter cellulosivorans]|uniref:T9SS type A sorting domain-containing protein n=1 Tax=Hymenobacter cellulosivorans TaxID=2932249 RepID=A0ABY4FED3_9BACT|nr:T9SS type A sorting domain-containing protein [Hymenobacter cellulosivorans]UOQ55045.1 T9SS type A sorting domain-containing protein [Hymenobacter cellulosivorans]